MFSGENCNVSVDGFVWGVGDDAGFRVADAGGECGAHCADGLDGLEVFAIEVGGDD